MKLTSIKMSIDIQTSSQCMYYNMHNLETLVICDSGHEFSTRFLIHKYKFKYSYIQFFYCIDILSYGCMC